MRCGVLGSPIAHSLSPTLHRAAYRELGLDWGYDAHDVDEAGLADFMAALGPDWRGLSLTMPLKREIIGYCDRVESLGAMLESINTVVIGVDGSRAGHNTDVTGFVRAVRAVTAEPVGTALVIGGGATAASALAALGQLGAHRATIAVRTPARAERLAALGPALRLDLDVIRLDDVAGVPPVDIAVSTIPAEGQQPVAAAVAAAAPLVFDVIYHPAVTPILAAATDRGSTCIGGFELLLHQAARQVELMTGARRAPLEAMRAAGIEALAKR